MITISSVNAGEINTDEDQTLNEEIAIDNGDSINLNTEEAINEETSFDTNNEILSSYNENSISNENEVLVGDGNTEIESRNITPSGNSFSAIQNAINSASEGDNIILDGTYIQDEIHPGAWQGNYTLTINVTKKVNIIGVNNAVLIADATVPPANYNQMMRILVNGVVLKNITFENGKSSGPHHGGALLCEDYNFTLENCKFSNNKIYIYNEDKIGFGGALALRNSYCTITNCSFENNYCDPGGQGGAILINGNSTVKFYNTSFEANHGTSNAGAVLVVGADTDFSHIEFTNCSFNGNYAKYGGAILLTDNTECQVINCYFENNSAIEGGAILSDGNISIVNCTFINNSANYGGAIYLMDVSNLTNCSFINCSSLNAGGALNYNTSKNSILSDCDFVNCSSNATGGAINLCNLTTDISIDSCNFTNCSSNSDGGAIYAEDCENVYLKHSNFINNSINNDEEGSGGAIYSNGSFTIENCSFINNSAPWEGACRIGNSSVVNCSFVNNFVINDIGAIRIDDGSVVNCSFEGNSAGKAAGAIYSNGSLNVLNCSFINNFAHSYGGGIHSSSLTAVNCSFVNNNNPGGAGGIYSSKGCIANCSFENNSGYKGGAIGGGTISVIDSSFVNNSATHMGGALSIDRPDCINCSFVNCTTPNVAGAIYSSYSGNITNCSFVNCSSGNIAGALRMGKGSIKECNFENCSASNFAGALWIADSASVEDSTFVNNSGTVAGGAIYVNELSNFYKISNCTFDNNVIINVSQGENRAGGAIYCLALNGEIINSHFNNNTSPDAGGAVFVSENTTSMNITDCKFNNNSVLNDFQGENRGGGAICSLSNGLNIYKSNFVSNNALSSFGGAVRLINPNNGVFQPTIRNSAFNNNDALDGTAVYTDDGSILVLNGFKYDVGEDINKIVHGLSMENLTDGYNTFTESKLNSSISPTNMTFLFGESIIIPISSENVNNITVTILDENYQVVFTKEGVVANGEFVVTGLDAGTYTVNYVAVVDENVFNPSYAGSRLTINKVKSTVSASAVTAYYGKAFSIKVNSNNATSIKYTIKNSKGTAVKSGTIAAGASITGLSFAPGTYTLSLSTVVDGNHTSSSASSKITVKKSTAAFTAKALTKYYAAAKKWSIKLMDKTNNKVIANQKITVRVYTGKKYKNYSVKTNAKGIATFNAPAGLKVGTHKVILIFSHNYYTCKSLTSKIVVKKHPLNIRISFQQFTDGSRTVDVIVKSKVTNKPVNKMKLKVLIYTGSKVTKKYLKLVSGYYKFNKVNGFAMYGGGIKAFGKAGAHKIKVMPNDSRYSGTSNIIKISVPKTAKNIKTVVVSNGKYTTVK